MDANTDNTKINAAGEAQNLCKQLEVMIGNQDWDGVSKILLHQQQHNACYKKMLLQIITSKELQFTLLRKRQNKKAVNLLLVLVTTGGKDLIMITRKNDKRKRNLLRLALELKNVSFRVISKLIDVGDRSLMIKKREKNGSNLLHFVLGRKIESSTEQVVMKLIEVGGRDLVMEKDSFSHNSLQIACYSNASIYIVSKLVEVGGKDAVMAKDNNCWNSLVLALVGERNTTIDVVSKLVEAGGKDVVVAKDESGHNALYHAYHNKRPDYVVLKLIEIGGKDAVMAKDNDGCNILSYACRKNPSIDIISKILEVGGMDVVVAKDKSGRNSLHYVWDSFASDDVISRLIEIGGKDAVLAKNKSGCNQLHLASFRFHVSIDVLDLLIRHGGGETLLQVDKKGMTALHNIIVHKKFIAEQIRRVLIKRVSYCINKGIELEVGGEYAIGGLFDQHTNQTVKNALYNRWNKVVLPALEQVMAIPRNQNQPIVHALIMDKAPPLIIKDYVNRYPDLVNTTDYSGQYPIDIAVHHGLAWNDGVKEIVETFAVAQQSTDLYVCAKHGVQWENGTKEVLGGSDVDILQTVDISTNLYPFMTAAVVGDKFSYDVDSVFHFIQKNPQLVRQYGGKSILGKRKRRVL